MLHCGTLVISHVNWGTLYKTTTRSWFRQYNHN